MSASETSRLELFPLAIGAYEEHGALDVEPELSKVAGLFAEFGADVVPWAVPMADRGADAVDRRLREWSRPADTSNSVLYWLGHGWSDGFDVALAHARSPTAVRGSGCLPAQLAEPVRARQAASGDHWAIVVIDTCWSARFVDKVNAELAAGILGADRTLLVGVSGDGATALGRFSAALRLCLTENFRSDQAIELWRLAAELDRRLPAGLVVARRLGAAALVRRASPLSSAVTLPLDLMAELETVLSGLPPDERAHFVDKARSAQESELAWFFEGREAERAEAVRWLRTAPSGMLIVTGRAGSGKSALLGHLLMHSQPELRSVLTRAHLADSLPADQRPADRAFDAAIRLTGMTLSSLLERIAALTDCELPARAAGPADIIDQLVDHLHRRDKPLTLLFDAVDEAVEPLVLARTVLRRIAAVPGVRTVIGTRPSAREGLLQPEPDEDDILDALTAMAPPGFARLVWMTPDGDAVGRYVTRRLTAARDRGRLGPVTRHISPDQIAAAAEAVRQRQGNFLYAHLAVHEMVADAGLLDAVLAGHADSLPEDHGGLFARAIERLARQSPALQPLARALALSRGRGVPIVGGVWSTMATALSAVAVSDSDISGFLAAAQPYVVTDTEGGQTVYRFAHRVFAEHFLDQPDVVQWQRQIARGLTRLAAEDSPPSPYVVAHLSGHIADAAAWQELALSPALLDRLDPLAVTADALRSLFGRAELPLPVAAVIRARHRLAVAAQQDRAGLRQLASAELGGRELGEDATPARPWVIRGAHVEQAALYVTLPGHVGYVTSLAAAHDARLGQVLASVGDDGTIRLWDPATALPIGAPMTGHSGPVSSVCTVPGPGGRTLLVSAGADGTIRVWDLAAATAIGQPLTGHVGGVSAVCAVPLGGGRVLAASAGSDGTVRLWDVTAGMPVGPPLTGHEGVVLGVCVVPAADGRILLASCGADETVRLWDPGTARPAGQPLRGHAGVVAAVCAVPGPNGQTLLASSGDDRSIRLWDPGTGSTAGAPLTGHTAGVESLAMASGLGGEGGLLVSAGADGTLRMWDTMAGVSAGVPLSSMAGGMWAVTTVTSTDGRTLVASAGEDGNVRLWDLSKARNGDEPLAVTPAPVAAVATAVRPGGRTDLVSMTMNGTVCRWDARTMLPAGFAVDVEPGLMVMARVVTVAGRPLLASAEHDGTVRRWDEETLTPYGEPLRGHDGPVLALAAVPGPAGTELLASGGVDGLVRLWNPASDGPPQAVLAGHAAAIRSFCPVAAPDGRQLLASGDMAGTVRLWDLAAGAMDGAPIAGHDGPVLALASPAPGTVAVAGVDGSVRCWDVASHTPVGSRFTTRPSIIRAMCRVSSWLASAGADGGIRLSDLSLTGTGVNLAGHGATIRDMCPVASPAGGEWLASCGHDGTMRVWDPSLALPVGAPVGGHPESVSAIATIPGAGETTIQVLAGETGKLRVRRSAWTAPRVLDVGLVVTAVSGLPVIPGVAIIGTSEGRLALVRVDGEDGTSAGQTALTTVHVGDSAVVALCALPGEPLVAAALADGSLVTWNPVSTRSTTRLAALHDGPIRSVQMAGPATVLTAGQDGLVRLTDLATGDPVCPAMTGHTGWAWSARLASDGRLAASAGSDSTVRFWDTATGKPIGAPLVGHTDQVRSVCFLSGTAVASAGHDGTIRIWDIQSRRLLNTLELGLQLNVLDCQAGMLTVGTPSGIVDLALDASLLSS